MKSNHPSPTHETAEIEMRLNINKNSAMPERATPRELPCAVAGAECRVIGRFPRSVELWRRALGSAAALFLVTLWAPIASAQTALINGTNATGTLVVSTTNSYTFTANTGDNINLRVGTTNFDAWLQLFGPDGKLLVSGTDDGYTDAYINNYTATNSGTFTVLVSSWFTGGTGTYALHLAQIPEAFVVPAGDQGGPLANGANATGTITLGDLDMWTFTANTGDNISLRLGTTNFDAWLQLYGPDGALLVSGTHDGYTDASSIPTRRPTAALSPCWSASTIRQTPAPMRCIWPRFQRLSLCRRAMKAGR